MVVDTRKLYLLFAVNLLLGTISEMILLSLYCTCIYLKNDDYFCVCFRERLWNVFIVDAEDAQDKDMSRN